MVHRCRHRRSDGSSSVTIAGTLSNGGLLEIGRTDGYDGTPTQVTADALVNTGQITLTGKFRGTPTATATLEVTGNAVNSNVIDINVGATLFAGTYLQTGGDTDVGGALIATAMTLAGGALHGTGLHRSEHR